MAVLIEAICVVIKFSSISRVFPDLKVCTDIVPNDAHCLDQHLFRVGFMAPEDMQAFIVKLESKGLVHLKDDKAIDMVIMDQTKGIMDTCDWIEAAKMDLEKEGQSVFVCRLIGDESNEIAIPDDWEYETSLSNSYGYVPNGQIDKSLSRHFFVAIPRSSRLVRMTFFAKPSFQNKFRMTFIYASTGSAAVASSTLIPS